MKKYFLIICLILFLSCEGKEGPMGPSGSLGPPGPQGDPGTNLIVPPDPSVDIISFSWRKELIIDWWTYANITIQNTGNTYIQSVYITIKYYDMFNVLITTDGPWLIAVWLDPNDVASFTDWLTSMTVEPVFGTVVITSYTWS